MGVKEEKSVQRSTTKDIKTQTSFTRISPASKLLITEHGLDALSIMASGPHGTLLKGDVLSAIKSGKGSSRISETEKNISQSSSLHPSTSSSTLLGSKSDVQQTDAYEDLPNSQIRKVFIYFLLSLIFLLSTVRWIIGVKIHRRLLLKKWLSF